MLYHVMQRLNFSKEILKLEEDGFAGKQYDIIWYQKTVEVNKKRYDIRVEFYSKFYDIIVYNHPEDESEDYTLFSLPALEDIRLSLDAALAAHLFFNKVANKKNGLISIVVKKPNYGENMIHTQNERGFYCESKFCQKPMNYPEIFNFFLNIDEDFSESYIDGIEIGGDVERKMSKTYISDILEGKDILINISSV